MMQLVNGLAAADIAWCCIDGVAVNHWAFEPVVTQDVKFTVATAQIQKAVQVLERSGFVPEQFDLSINFKGGSTVSLRIPLL